MLRLLQASTFLLINVSSVNAINKGNSIATDLKSRLQGEWNCLKITNSSGEISEGDFGDLGGFLRFTFERNNLFVSLAPFDKGLKLPVIIQESSFFIIAEDKTKIEYRVDSIGTQSLVLMAKTRDGELLTYFFDRTNIHELRSTDKVQRHYALVIVIYSDQQAFSALKTYPKYSFYEKTIHYLIPREQKSYLPCPLFIPPKPHNFSSHFLFYFDKTKADGIDSVNYELILDLDITSEGVKNIEIVRGLSYQLNGHVFDILHDNKKLWKLTSIPIAIGRNDTTRIRISFFIVGGQMQTKFKKS